MFSCERQDKIGGGVLLYGKVSPQPMKLKTMKINNMDSVFLYSIVRKKICYCLNYTPSVYNISSDKKLQEQITEISYALDTVICGNLDLVVISRGNPLRSHSGRG